MKLVFTGEKVLEEMTTLKSEEAVVTADLTAAARIADVNRVFANGLSVPLAGLEIPVMFYASGNLAHNSDCDEVKKPELDGKVLTIGSDVEFARSDGDFKIYAFGLREMGEAIFAYLKQEAAKSPSTKSAYDDVFGGLTDDKAMRKLVYFMMPQSPRLSTKQFMLFDDDGLHYVADNGSVVGTWVDGVKLGYNPERWHHWESLDPVPLAKELGCSTFDIMVDVLYANGVTIHGQKALYQEGKSLVMRLMNCGTSTVKEGSTIALGSDNFKTEEGRPHYKFTLKE